MKESRVAKRYARALVMSIKNQKEYEKVRKILGDFLRLINTNEEFKLGMETLLFSKKQKKALLSDIQKEVNFEEKVFNFIQILIEENRLMFLDSIIRLMEDYWFAKIGVEKLKVYSSVNLNEQQENELTKNLEKSFQKKVFLEKEIDQSLIAGIKIQRGSVVYDFSIAGNLRKLKEAFLEES